MNLNKNLDKLELFKLNMAKFKENNISFLNNNLKTSQLGFSKRTHDYLFETNIHFREGKFDILNIGAFTYLGGKSTIIRKVKSIGRFCSIAGNVTISLFEHPVDNLSTHHIFHSTQWLNIWPSLNNLYQDNLNIKKAINSYKNKFKPEDYDGIIGNDVWIGENVTIMKGIIIGDGAIIAANAIVTKNVEPYSIVGGVPAKIIKYRFSQEIISELLKIQWWDYGLSILKDVDFTDINQAILEEKKRLKSIKEDISSKLSNNKEIDRIQYNVHLLLNNSSSNLYKKENIPRFPLLEQEFFRATHQVFHILLSVRHVYSRSIYSK